MMDIALNVTGAPECPCCRKMVRTGDSWHCKDCWEKHHNGKRDNDWLNRDEWEKSRKRYYCRRSRKRRKVCDECGSDKLHYYIKGYLKCDRCKRLYAKNHKFDVMIE